MAAALNTHISANLLRVASASPAHTQSPLGPLPWLIEVANPESYKFDFAFCFACALWNGKAQGLHCMGAPQTLNDQKTDQAF